MTKITITIKDDERSFSATVDPSVEDVIQAVDAALQGLGWHYNTVRNTIYELYREKMEADDMLDDTFSDEEEQEYLQEKINQATPRWRGVNTQKFMDEVRGREPMEYRIKWRYKEGNKCGYGEWGRDKRAKEEAARFANENHPDIEHYIEERLINYEEE